METLLTIYLSNDLLRAFSFSTDKFIFMIISSPDTWPLLATRFDSRAFILWGWRDSQGKMPLDLVCAADLTDLCLDFSFLSSDLLHKYMPVKLNRALLKQAHFIKSVDRFSIYFEDSD